MYFYYYFSFKCFIIFFDFILFSSICYFNVFFLYFLIQMFSHHNVCMFCLSLFGSNVLFFYVLYISVFSPKTLLCVVCVQLALLAASVSFLGALQSGFIIIFLY